MLQTYTAHFGKCSNHYLWSLCIQKCYAIYTAKTGLEIWQNANGIEVGIENKDLSKVHCRLKSLKRIPHELLALRKPRNPDYSRRILVIRLLDVTSDKRIGKVIKRYLIVSLPSKCSNLVRATRGRWCELMRCSQTQENRGTKRLLESQWHDGTLPHRCLTHDFTAALQPALMHACMHIMICMIRMIMIEL